MHFSSPDLLAPLLLFEDVNASRLLNSRFAASAGEGIGTAFSTAVSALDSALDKALHLDGEGFIPSEVGKRYDVEKAQPEQDREVKENAEGMKIVVCEAETH